MDPYEESDINRASQKLVVNFSSSATSNALSAADFIGLSNVSQRSRVSHVFLRHAYIPNSWPVVHEAFLNTTLLVTVFVAGVPTLYTVVLASSTLNGPTTASELAAALQTSLNAATAGPAITWTVVYDPVTRRNTVSITSGGGATFHFSKLPGENNDSKNINRALMTIGFFNLAHLNPTPGVSAVSTLGSLVDLNVVKSVIIQLEGAPHGAESNAWASYGAFVVPVTSNYGDFSRYDEGVSFLNAVLFNDYSFNTVNFRLRLLDITGNLLPLNGGTPELILETTTRAQKRARGYF